MTIRQKRVLRWTLVFNTENGADYLKQLEYFKAILAIPLAQGQNQYDLLDLSQKPVVPRQTTYDELGQLKRIFWVDNQAESVRSLAEALKLPFQPSLIVAFFPLSFEQELLAKEHDFQGLTEDDIKETKFKVVRAGEKKYKIVVADQVKR